ncbi:MAG: HD domain-containing protein [Gammaproteobacteria bacterium]|nr:MAG: HD domain-containing protein [Gammaproteobacteria bacterium]
MAEALRRAVVAWLAARQEPLWLVGGTIRDRLLGRDTEDIDVAVAGDALALARALADRFGGSYYPLDEDRGTGRAILEDADGQRLVVDLARLRAADIEGDLADRDFAINAMAAPPDRPDEVLDPFGGRADLAAGRIRPVSENSIRRDPVRALRAVRLAAQLGFELAPEAEVPMRRDGPRLSEVSAERVRDELMRLLGLPQAAPWLRRLEALGLLPVVLPELDPLRGVTQSAPHCLDVFDHSLAVVAELEGVLADWRPPAEVAEALQAWLAAAPAGGRPRRALLKLGALLHDLGKPATRREEAGRIRFLGHEEAGVPLARAVMQRLRFSRSETRLLETLVRYHLRPLLLTQQPSVSRRAIYCFFRDTGDNGAGILLHALADWRGTCPGRNAPPTRLEQLIGRMLRFLWGESGAPSRSRPLLGGRDLIALGVPPGPRIGELLARLREAQAAGEVTDREGALQRVAQWLAESGEDF